jgi:hypothetical protein
LSLVVEPSLRRQALRYAREGLRVLPCAPLAKPPLLRDWPKRASLDIDQIARWWARWPEANIGLLCGQDGFDVLDIDNRPGGSGYPALERVAGLGLASGASRLVSTPSGGLHLYYPGSSQAKGRLDRQFVDFQASGSYVLAPPSRVLMADGSVGTYELIDMRGSGRTLDWQAVRRAFTSPAATRTRTRGAARQVGTLATQVKTAPEGARNRTLYVAARRSLDLGKDPWLLRDAGVKAGLTPGEVDQTIRSAQRGARRKGRM